MNWPPFKRYDPERIAKIYAESCVEGEARGFRDWLAQEWGSEALRAIRMGRS
jgi:hypothetical protein